MTYDYSLHYTGSLYMGSSQIEIDSIIFDTGSDYLVLNTIDCIDCNSSYNYTTSETAGNYTSTDTAITKYYLDYTFITGKLA
jgi:hypothetical protein